MSEDMRNEAIELIVTACEKYAANNEVTYQFRRACIREYNCNSFSSFDSLYNPLVVYDLGLSSYL